MAKVAFLFPGQGAQTVGMGRALCASFPAASERFDRASTVLGYDLLDVCVNGPPERLNSTAVSQPAIFVTSIAALELLKKEHPDALDACQAAAGLSLGEFTALAFAGAMSFDDGLRLVKKRGESMQAASDQAPSGMISVIGLELPKVTELVEQARGADVLVVANLLCPANYAVSGHRSACDRMADLAEAAGARVVRLAVAGAFHTSLMGPAQRVMAEIFEAVPLQSPRLPVWSNVTAHQHGEPDSIRGLLSRQMVEPVRWEETIRELLANGFDRFFEIGPGRVLAGLLKRVQRKVDIQNVGA